MPNVDNFWDDYIHPTKKKAKNTENNRILNQKLIDIYLIFNLICPKCKQSVDPDDSNCRNCGTFIPG